MNLRELADLLGLSQTTVSRALNGYPEVSAATRRRVEAAALAHNYRPNARARGLATGRSMAIAHVFPTSLRDQMVNPTFHDFFAGASEVYTAHGYDMLLTLLDDGEDSRFHLDLRARRAADGIIFHAPGTEPAAVDLLRATGLPFVVHGRVGDAENDYNWVDMDNRRAFARATAFLIDLGHRRIALVNGPGGMDFACRRCRGYREALEALGQTFDPGLVFADEMTEFFGHEAACAMLEMPDPPTAVLASSLIVALGIRRACDGRGLRLARDLSVIAHDDVLTYFRNGRSVPDFTALRSPIREHGRRAAAMLLRVIDDPSAGPQNEMLEADFNLGQSTGPAPRARMQEQRIPR